MDFEPSTDERRFRGLVRRFIVEQTEDWTGYIAAESDAEWQYSMDFCKKLSDRGWVGVSWPREYGGGGEPYTFQLILLEEMAYAMAPREPLYFGWDRVAWTLLLHGTEEQKRRHLPRIQAADDVWCQAFTEPEAGSDLAATSTVAVPDGDGFRLRGEKKYNSAAWRADWALCPARTDSEGPKHAGLSYFLLNLRSEGVKVKRLNDMLDQAHFGRIILNDVYVSSGDLLGGRMNGGWRQMTKTLDAERAGVAVTRLGYCRRGLDEIAAVVGSNAELGDAAWVRAEIAALYVQVAALRALAYRVGWIQGRGEVPAHEAAMAKLFGGELQQRIYSFAMEVLGVHGLFERGDPGAVRGGRLTHEWLESFGQTIAGGTSEIQRDVIANGLGLPRESASTSRTSASASWPERATQRSSTTAQQPTPTNGGTA